jgi:predicted transcriptional regulator
MLKRHIMIAHGLSPAEYRHLFQLRSDYPMTAPNYAKKRSQLARQFGLGTHVKRE